MSAADKRPEPYSATVMAVLAAAFSVWALLTLPLPGAFILTAAGLLAWAGWVAHFVFPILEGGYFPGLYTAGGHLIMSAVLICFLVRESRELKAADTTERIPHAENRPGDRRVDRNRPSDRSAAGK